MTKPHTRESVYNAEFTMQAILENAQEAPTVQIHGSTIAVPIERKFGDLASVQRYVDAVLVLNWVRAAFPKAGPVTVRERKGDRLAHHFLYEIAIPVEHRASRGSGWAMRETVVLHELAHHLTPGYSHNAMFTEAFVFLVSGVMGEEAGFLLRSLFYDEGVQVG